jgi:hypothetical protein
MEWDGWNPDDEYVEEEHPRDPAIDAAKAAINSFFQDDDHRKHVFYVMQLQVLFEREFYHWITYKAVDELVDEEELCDEVRPLASTPGPTVRFIFHPGCRSTKRQIARKLALIRRFSDEEVSRGCGRYAEILFSRGLMMNGFRFIAENAREYQGQSLTSDDSSSDLDYIFERDGHVYGCEIKNRFGYISRSLLTSKMRICRQLGVTPLFILRMAPKNYIETVRNPGPGFTLIFQTHIYTQGHRQLVEDIKREFQGLPVDCPRDLPGSIINRFLRWHRLRPSTQAA